MLRACCIGIHRFRVRRSLRQIWQELKNLGANLGSRIDARLDQTNARLESVTTELKGEIRALRKELRDEVQEMGRARVESELRIATSITEVATNVRALTELHRASTIERDRLTQCERRLDSFEERLRAD